MTQYVDHSYDSCLNFASYFSVTCGSLINPVDITATTFAALNTAQKTSKVRLENAIQGDCDEFSKESWTSTYSRKC